VLGWSGWGWGGGGGGPPGVRFGSWAREWRGRAFDMSTRGVSVARGGPRRAPCAWDGMRPARGGVRCGWGARGGGVGRRWVMCVQGCRLLGGALGMAQAGFAGIAPER